MDSMYLFFTDENTDGNEEGYNFLAQGHTDGGGLKMTQILCHSSTKTWSSISSHSEFSQVDAAEVKTFSFGLRLKNAGIFHLCVSGSSELLCKKSGYLPAELMVRREVLQAHREQEAWPSLR